MSLYKVPMFMSLLGFAMGIMFAKLPCVWDNVIV